MEKSVFKDFEYIIVDDGSDYRQRIEDLADEFKFIKLKRIEPKDKWWVNPCIPFNMGIAMAQGEIIILQSPECMHMGDVINFVANNSKDNQYLVFACYSLSHKSSNNLESVDFNLSLQDIEDGATKAIGGFSDKSCDTAGRYNSWFAHPVYRNCIFNFLVSMTATDMRDIGGFDERFAHGFAFDDSELAVRVMKKGMSPKIVEKPFCLHQFHASVLEYTSELRIKEAKNKKLYEDVVNSSNYKAVNSFHLSLVTAGIKHVYYESPGTDHEWLTWRRSLNEFAPLLFK
jgi:glycosyltransferase involved in cell wall biosynthesis